MVVSRGQTAIFFYRAFIACSISARRKKRVWSRSITRVVLDTSEPTGGVDFSDLKVIRNSFAYTASDKRPVEKNSGLATRD